MTFDASDLNAFAAELARAPEIVRKEIRPVFTKGSLNVKKDWNDSFRESKHFKGVGGSVNFDTEVTRDGVESEIGPDLDRFPGVAGRGKARPAAPLASIATFGGANGGGGKVPDPQKHLDAEESRLIAALDAVIRKAIS